MEDEGDNCSPLTLLYHYESRLCFAESLIINRRGRTCSSLPKKKSFLGK